MFVSGRVGGGLGDCCLIMSPSSCLKSKGDLTEGTLSNIPFWGLINLYTAWMYITILTRNSHTISHQLL
jgi:hypothetical protein